MTRTFDIESDAKQQQQQHKQPLAILHKKKQEENMMGRGLGGRRLLPRHQQNNIHLYIISITIEAGPRSTQSNRQS